MTPEKEHEIREHVKALKDFYTNLVLFGAIIVACVIIWLSSGGPFWPIWVIIGLGISAILQGSRLGVIPMLPEVLPFLKKDWEEQQIKTLLNDDTVKEAPKKKTQEKKD